MIAEPVSMVDASLKMSIVNLFKKLKEGFGESVLILPMTWQPPIMSVIELPSCSEVILSKWDQSSVC